MFNRQHLIASLAVIVIATASGCAVTRGQETVGAYVDDAEIGRASCRERV